MCGSWRRIAPIVAVGILLTGPPAHGAWKSVTVLVEEPDGSTREIRGTSIGYGHYTREFTNKGTRDRLRVEKNLVFPDRDIRFSELDAIEFTLEMDSTAGVKVPTTMALTFLPRRNEVVTMKRELSELRGYGQPKPILLIVTTSKGKVRLDLTPPYEEDARREYRPILRVDFE